MKLGFMSSVCPNQTLGELTDTAKRHNYEGIEFRTEWDHGHGVELAANREQRREIRQMLSDQGIVPTCLATSVRFNSEDAAERETERETLRKYIVLAAEIGMNYIRTFGDPVPADDPGRLRQTLRREAESYALIADWAEAHGVDILIEMHGNLRADHVQTILKAAGCDHVSVLWHIGHHIRHGQSVDEAYPLIRRRIRHLHFSAQPGKTTTDEDNRRCIELLAADQFGGFFSVEVINPSDPEAVLVHHESKFREFMAEGTSET